MQPLLDNMRHILVQAQTERATRRSFELDPVEQQSVCGWELFERRAMLAAVNGERASRGLAPVAERDIVDAERSAVGHVDYTDKFALYCARLAVGLEP